MIVFAGRYNASEILSGPEKVAKRIFHLQAKKEKTIFIQYFFDGRIYNLWTKLFGKEIFFINEESYVITVGLLRIFSVLIKIKPQIFHIITFERFALILYIYKIFSKTKFIYNIHGLITFANYNIKKVSLFLRMKDKFCEKIFLKYSDKLIIPSRMLIDTLNKFNNFDSKKIKVIPHGCDSEFNQEKRSNHVDKNIKIAIQSDKIGFKSALPFILDGLKEINGKIVITVIGDYSGYDLIKNRFPNTIYQDKFDVKEFAHFLNETDIFLSLIKYDSFSISALESMAAGAVTIVTKETGISEFIDNRVNGFIVSYGDSIKLSQIIKSLINNNNLIDKISKNSIKIYKTLNWEKIFEQYSLIYQNLLS